MGGSEHGEPDEPTPLRSPSALTREERRVVVAAVLAPIAVATLILVPIAWRVGAGIADVIVAAAVYGGLVGAAAAFVAVDRLHARQCTRCHRRADATGQGIRSLRGLLPTRVDPGDRMCAGCGYDLIERPRFACSEGHDVYLDAGLCRCGRRLQPLPAARGVGPQVRFVLRIGAWLLAFLIGVGLVLQLLDRTL